MEKTKELTKRFEAINDAAEKGIWNLLYGIPERVYSPNCRCYLIPNKDKLRRKHNDD